jgi:hypothetical protein
VLVFRDPETDVVASAARALAKIALETAGALIVVEAGASQSIDQLLGSLDSDIRICACNLLGILAIHESTASAAWQESRCHRLVKLSWCAILISIFIQYYLAFLTSDDSPAVAESAVYALSLIAYWPDGALSVVQAGILKHSDELLESAIIGVRGWACRLIERLACYESTASTLVKINPCPRLVALLRYVP